MTRKPEVAPVDGGGQPDGNKGLVTFFYTTSAGDSAEVTLFVKRCVWKGRSEAVHYRHLTERGGVPTPQLYGTLAKPGTGDSSGSSGGSGNSGGNEIIFLERLSATGFRKESEEEWRAMLSLLARFNACPITPDYQRHLHPYEQIGMIKENQWISGLGAWPAEEEIASNLRGCGATVPERDLPALVEAAQALFGRVAAHPPGLLHQDFVPDNFGWCRRGDRDKGEMVVFDLHKNALGPRFADVAPYLCVPGVPGKQADFLNAAAAAAALPVGISRRETLIRHYLSEYARFGGPVVSLDTFVRETTELFWAQRISILPWLAAAAADEQSSPEAASPVHEVLDFLRREANGEATGP